MISTAGVTYTYDGDGKRVMKSTGKLYWYGAGGDVLLEGDPAQTYVYDEHIYFNGQRIARRSQTSQTNSSVYYFFSDHLGSSRIVTNSSGTVVEDSDFYPFGAERVVLDSLNNNYKFTGQERDAESGLDYFIARHYAFSLGRFLQADPSRASEDKFQPQSWNRYSYTLNSPTAYTDPNGQWPTWVHDEILQVAFAEVLSQRQIDILKRVSYEVDFTHRGQDPNNSFRHGMCAPGQTLGPCARLITGYIYSNIRFAQAAQAATGSAEISDNALGYFGAAAHTLTDMPSPSHSAANGTPLTWTGGPRETVVHVWGERAQSVDWLRFGQSVRNVIAGFYEAFPQQASRLGDPNALADRAIERAVSVHYAPVRQHNPMLEGRARLCALGNPAAC